MNGWTSERRARQARLIHSWKPWAKSTGPKTLGGNPERHAQDRLDPLRCVRQQQFVGYGADHF